MSERTRELSPHRVQTAALAGFTPLERAGFALLLGEQSISVVIDVSDAESLVTSGHHADVALVECSGTRGRITNLKGLRSSLAHLQDRQQFSRIFGIYRSFSGTAPASLAALGFDALVDAEAEPATLLELIAGSKPALRNWPRLDAPLAPLTVREHEILRLIAEGRPTRVIASTLDISVHTVDSHKQRLFRRLNVQNQAQAVSVALRLGLLDTIDLRGAAS